jgi:hypothetical protein
MQDAIRHQRVTVEDTNTGVGSNCPILSGESFRDTR